MALPPRERRKSPVSSKEATKRWAEQRAAFIIIHGKPQHQSDGADPEHRALTLGEFAPRFIEWAQTERHKPSEVAGKEQIIRKHLVPLMGDKPLDQLTPLDVHALKNTLKDRSPKTVNNVLAVLSKLLKVAVDLGVISVVPVTVKGKKAEAPEMSFSSSRSIRAS